MSVAPRWKMSLALTIIDTSQTWKKASGMFRIWVYVIRWSFFPEFQLSFSIISNVGFQKSQAYINLRMKLKHAELSCKRHLPFKWKCLEMAYNDRQKQIFLTISKSWTYFYWYVECSNCTIFQDNISGLKNAKNVKIDYWVLMRIFNNLRCWFSIASADIFELYIPI